MTGQQYITLAPYPGLDATISLQAWAHQLKVDSAGDPRIGQFITALRLNQYVYPETGATCEQPTFDIANPPAFDTTAGAGRRGADVRDRRAAGSTMSGDASTTGADTAGSETAGSERGDRLRRGIVRRPPGATLRRSSVPTSSTAKSSG